uniref:Uncharacterized protein n=1 Tax=Setaria viridis TaxID=4556 RepID=A0A4V6DCE6_SETVI|nr:hypothetical protein SEVIR_3G083900v2 [Setaria viridis]
MGDFLEPILEKVRSSLPPADTQQSVRSPDPEFQPVQNSKASVVGPSTGPGFESGSYSSWARRNPGLASLCRRLTQRPCLVQDSYVQVLMAGRCAAAGGAGGGGDQRPGRNYSGQFRATRGQGRPPGPYGGGRGRDQGKAIIDFVYDFFS